MITRLKDFKDYKIVILCCQAFFIYPFYGRQIFRATHRFDHYVKNKILKHQEPRYIYLL
jgi:hypothetical protein